MSAWLIISQSDKSLHMLTVTNDPLDYCPFRSQWFSVNKPDCSVFKSHCVKLSVYVMVDVVVD